MTPVRLLTSSWAYFFTTEGMKKDKMQMVQQNAMQLECKM